MSDGAEIRVRRYGNTEGARIILSHGNGFAIDAYYPFWRLLLSDFEVIIYDQRNHGWNLRHQISGHTVDRMAEDMDTIISSVTTSFGKRRTVGIFHSLSTLVGLVHHMKYGLRWDALILVDPPLRPPPGHHLHKLARNFEISLRDWALRRTKYFSSPDALAAYFKCTRRARRWLVGAAELMARAITRPAADGTCELICPPEFESRIFAESAGAISWSTEGLFVKHLLVMSSDYTALDADPPGKMCEALAMEFGISVTPIPETGHLLQIERPDFAIQVVRDYLNTLHLNGTREAK